MKRVWVLAASLAVVGCKEDTPAPAVEVKKDEVVERTDADFRPAIDDLALGSEHLCALSHGRVFCAGDQTDPRGATLAAATEWKAIEMPETVVSIASSNLRTCAVTETGKLACWGGYNQLPRRVEAVENVADVSVFGRWKLMSQDGGIVSYDNTYAIRHDGKVVRIIGESGQPLELDLEDIASWSSVDYLCDDCEHFGYWLVRHRDGAVEWGEIRADDGDRYPSKGTLVEGASQATIAHLGESWALAFLAVVDEKPVAYSTDAEALEVKGPEKVDAVDGLCYRALDQTLWCYLETAGSTLEFVQPFGEQKAGEFVVEKGRVCAHFDAIECRERASVVADDEDSIRYLKVIEPIPPRFDLSQPVGRSSDAD